MNIDTEWMMKVFNKRRIRIVGWMGKSINNDQLELILKDAQEEEELTPKMEVDRLSRENSNLIRSIDQWREMYDMSERTAAQQAASARETINRMMATIDELHHKIANLREAAEINEELCPHHARARHHYASTDVHG